MANILTLGTVDTAAELARASVLGSVPTARSFLLLSSVQGVYETMVFAAGLPCGRMQLIPPTQAPVKALVADIRGALSQRRGRDATILLTGLCDAPKSWLFADPEEPRIWRLEPDTRDPIKACLATPENPPGWRRLIRLDG